MELSGADAERLVAYIERPSPPEGHDAYLRSADRLFASTLVRGGARERPIGVGVELDPVLIRFETDASLEQIALQVELAQIRTRRFEHELELDDLERRARLARAALLELDAKVELRLALLDACY